MISAITYNIRYGKKLDKIINWLKKQETPYDIISFQEFPNSKIDQVLLALKPGEYIGKFAPAIIKNNEQFGEATFIYAKKIKVSDYKVVNLGANYLEKKILRNKAQRSSLIVKLIYNKKEFIIVNTHLICFALDSHRRNQILKVIEQIEAMKKKPQTPIIMLGDFNYSSLIRQKKLIDFMDDRDFINAYRAHTHKLLFLKQQLDYVFYKFCRVNEVHIDRLHLSDHYPVQFKVDF